MTAVQKMVEAFKCEISHLLSLSLTHTHLTSLSYFSKIFNHENYFYHYHQATTYHHHHQLWCTVVVEMNQRYQFVDFLAKDVLKGVVGTKFVKTCIKSIHFTEQLGQTIVCFNIKVKLRGAFWIEKYYPNVESTYINRNIINENDPFFLEKLRITIACNSTVR